ALLYGYQGNRGNLSGSVDEIWLATQILVWEFVTGCRNATGTYARTSTQIYDVICGSNYANSGTAEVYKEIIALLTARNTTPSFMTGGTTALEYKNGEYVLTLTDSNGVLDDYDFTASSSSVSVSKSGNTLTIRAGEAFDGTVRITATRNDVPTVSSSAKLLAYGDDTLQDVVTGVENAESVTAYMDVETPTGALALKKTSEDGKVAGITFTITGNGFSQSATTDENGTISIDGLAPGTYTVTEQTSDRYETQDSQTVTIVSGQTATVTFNNTLKRGSLSVIKSSEDGLVEGVTFHLYGTSLSGIAVDEYAVTDADGVATFENILIGSGYTLEETSVGDRYVVPDDQTVAIEWNVVTNKTVVNVLKKWRATVTKTDAETTTAQGDASLAGATYGVYLDGELVDTYTTDANGQFTTDYYVCGDGWTIQEISPSEGYLLDSTVYQVGAEAALYTIEYNSTTLGVTEQVITGSVAIIKHTDNGSTGIETPEEGAEFEVYLKSAGSYEAAGDSEWDYLICDENGYAATKDLLYGVYTVHQTRGWDGRELVSDFDVYVCEDGKVYSYIINNADFESYLKIVKTDAETGNTIPYAGAGFQIYDPEGNLVTMTYTYPEVTEIDTFYTNDKGYLITPEVLPSGVGYSVVEVQAPYGYVLDSTPVYFDVTAAQAGEESGITVIEVVRSDVPQKGVITVEKTGEVFSAVTVTGGACVDADGNETVFPTVYQPVYAVEGLAGAVFEITAAEDIYTPDGTLRCAQGQVVDTITTGEDGTAASAELYLGQYTVTEITAPDGYVRNSEAQTVELTYAGQEVAVTETSASFYNDRQRVSITLEKVMEQDETFGLGQNGEITLVSFGLYAAEELTAADGTAIPAGGLLEIVTVDGDGYAAFASDLPLGSYY
ncbi:MAG: carboxypeptidase regulatory-like domain-containing protein, partial [Lachnospiraceae bacterium]|nr:carboxypeptidase regulatory-like domain-containing protein [Lachnospiraceae bacterium]